MGEEAARLLLRRIEDRNGPPEQVIMPTRLIVRESCGAARRATARMVEIDRAKGFASVCLASYGRGPL